MADTLALNASGAPAGVLKLSRGGWQTGQQGPGSIGTNSYYVENIFEELDVPGEWFLRGDGTLTLIPPSDGPSAADNAPMAPQIAMTCGSLSRG